MVVETPDKVQTDEIQPVITLTDNAVARIRNLIESREAEGYALRVFISGGGCSGFQYGMALEATPRETDHRYQFDDMSVVVDPQSMGFLAGSTIDYSEDIMGGGFKIENPNAMSTCGCGQSFKTGSEGGTHEHAGHAHNGGCGCH